MDSIHEQIADLGQKVDATQQGIERLYRIVTEVLLEVRDINQNPGSEMISDSADGSGLSFSKGVIQGVTQGVRPEGNGHSFITNNGLQHKDILDDDGPLDGDISTPENALAPDMQVRRLTAQLTAAYNRIAALEEQLLSQRIYPGSSVG